MAEDVNAQAAAEPEERVAEGPPEERVAAEPDERVLAVAVTIRDELPTLVPAEAETLGGELDQLIAHATGAHGEERSATLDTIIEMLVSREPTRARFDELNLTRDVARGVSEDVLAADSLLGGEPAVDNNLLVFTCQTCGFANRLAFQPPDDDPPDCQNPNAQPHPLMIA